MEYQSLGELVLVCVGVAVRRTMYHVRFMWIC